MMSNSKPKEYAYFKLVAIFPIIISLMLVLNTYNSVGSEQTKEQQKKNETELKQKQKQMDKDIDKKADIKADFQALDEMPACDLKELSKNVVYPEEARKAGTEGKVFVMAYITEKGEVEKVKIEKSENKVFDNAAITAVKNTKFKSGMKDKKAVAAWVTIPIVFKLK